MRLTRNATILLFLAFASLTALPSCKAKSCDASNHVADEGSSKRKKKNLGLFSKKERRRKRF